jgi:23S rRNA pseudouridine1911/1915/1917 synthase
MIYRQLPQDEYDDLSSRILYEDNHLLIFNKLPGEIVQSDKTGDECLAETLKAFIAQRDSKPGKVYLGIPHRLDRPVSGIVVFAKTSKAMDRMSELFRTGAIHKTYWALCVKAPEVQSQELDDWLVRNEKMNKTFIARNGEKTPGAKLAKLIYRHLGDTERYALVEVQLLTGRHHQIRCQLANIGCVIKGDLKYGAPRSNPDGGISLHSRNIKFEHPVKKEPIDITAPVPASWKGVEKFL